MSLRPNAGFDWAFDQSLARLQSVLWQNHRDEGKPLGNADPSDKLFILLALPTEWIGED